MAGLLPVPVRPAAARTKLCRPRRGVADVPAAAGLWFPLALSLQFFTTVTVRSILSMPRPMPRRTRSVCRFHRLCGDGSGEAHRAEEGRALECRAGAVQCSCSADSTAEKTPYSAAVLQYSAAVLQMRQRKSPAPETQVLQNPLCRLNASKCTKSAC